MSEAGAGPAPDEWLDEEAGPVVRAYALTGGRTHSVHSDFDLIAIIETVDEVAEEPAVPPPPGAARVEPVLSPEQQKIREICRVPLSVAEVASDLGLALGVVRVLLGDLLGHGLIKVRRPAPVAQFPNERVLKEVIDGLHAL